MQVIQQKTSKQRRRLRYKQIQKVKRAMQMLVSPKFLGEFAASYNVKGERDHIVHGVYQRGSKVMSYACDCNNHPHCSHVLAVKIYRGEPHE